MIRRRTVQGATARLAIATLLAGTGALVRAWAADATGGLSATAPPTTLGVATGNPFAPTLSGIGTPAPPVGVWVRLGNLASIFAPPSAAAGAVPKQPLGLMITPTLGVEEEYTDNVFDTAGHHQTDFITNVTPGVLVNLQTPSVVGNLSYSPSFELYAKHPSQNNVGQYLSGSVDATLLPQTLLLSTGGYASELSTRGAMTPAGVTNVGSNTTATTTGFYVTPAFRHEFGDTGTLQVAYSLQVSNESGGANSVTGATQPFFLASSALTNQEIASFTTGPVLGRFQNTVDVDSSEYSGGPILDGAHEYSVVNTLRFALDRRTYVFGSAGYEDISYPSAVPSLEINGGVWAAGFGVTPAPLSTVILGYRHAYGNNAPIVQAAIGLTARTRLAIVYSSTIATGLQMLQSMLTGSTVDAAGNWVNSQTNAPVLIGNQLQSLQSGLMRISTLSASLVTTWPRDTVSFSLLNEQQKLLANAPGTAGFSQASWAGGIAWTHSLTPRLVASSYLEIGSTNSAAVGSGWTPALGGQLSLAYQLSPTLSSSLSYQVTYDWPNAGGGVLENTVMVALRNTF